MVYLLEKGRSKLKNKQEYAKFRYKGEERIIHYGDPSMKEYPGTKRGDSYCARSYGITDKKGFPTRNNPLSPNYWSRRELWNCRGRKSEK